MVGIIKRNFTGALIILVFVLSLASIGYSLELENSITIDGFNTFITYPSAQYIYLLGHKQVNDPTLKTVVVLSSTGEILHTYSFVYPAIYFLDNRLVETNDFFFLLYSDQEGHLEVLKYSKQFDYLGNFSINLSKLSPNQGHLLFWTTTRESNLYLCYVQRFDQLNITSFTIYRLEITGSIIWKLNFNLTVSEFPRLMLPFCYYSHNWLTEPYLPLSYGKHLLVVDVSRGELLWTKRLNVDIISVASTSSNILVAYTIEQEDSTQVALTAFRPEGVNKWTKFLSLESFMQFLSLGFDIQQNMITVRTELLVERGLKAVNCEYYEVFDDTGLSFGTTSREKEKDDWTKWFRYSSTPFNQLVVITTTTEQLDDQTIRHTYIDFYSLERSQTDIKTKLLAVPELFPVLSVITLATVYKKYFTPKGKNK